MRQLGVPLPAGAELRGLPGAVHARPGDLPARPAGRPRRPAAHVPRLPAVRRPRHRDAQHHRDPRHDVAHRQRRAPARVAAAAAGQGARPASTASSPSPTPRAAGRASRTTPPRCCARWPGSWSTRTSARSSRSISASSRSPTRGSRRSCASTGCRSTTCGTRSSASAAAWPRGWPRARQIVRGWIDAVEADVRTEEPLAGLRIALQCGGSDAFSGVSGNPLAGAIVHELIRHGGTGVLCETDETAGAEAYVLRNTRDIETARGVLAPHPGLQGAPVVARRDAGEQSVRRQQAARPLQHHAEVARRRAQEGSADAGRSRHRLRRSARPRPASIS